MTGRPGVKITWYRGVTPDYPLPPFLVGVVVYALVFLTLTIGWVALSSLSLFVYRTVENSVVIALFGFVIPFLSIYSIIKSLRFSRWMVAIQLVTPPMLVHYLIFEGLVEWAISPYVWAAVWFLVFLSLMYLFHGTTIRRYYAWVRGEEGSHHWVSPRWSRITSWVGKHEDRISLFFEVLFYLFALLILALPWILMGGMYR